jgi:hypothetical protein
VPVVWSLDLAPVGDEGRALWRYRWILRRETSSLPKM